MIIRHYDKSEIDLDGIMALLEELRGSKESERFSSYLKTATIIR
jgi:hypothetical protein